MLQLVEYILEYAGNSEIYVQFVKLLCVFVGVYDWLLTRLTSTTTLISVLCTVTAKLSLHMP
jgi:uncharacterized membrane protein